MARLFRRLRELAGGSERIWVEIHVSKSDIKKHGLNTLKPGPKLFTGLWYGRAPLDFRNYGKMVEPEGALPFGALGPQPYSDFILRRLR